ncbi:MAG: mechanosensitive ion channel [Candidatus Delongbacteria bacterium]|nr:mechanosensitive ion channel [bacterium]MBL7033739.1 mechanosensitive ion channel [Candidatus Delongbacteria bacterium]
MENLWPKVWEILALYGVKIVTALAVFLIGKWVASLVRRYLRKLMGKRQVDPVLITFTTSMVYATLMAFVIVATLARLDIQTTSFIAIIGAAGLAIGLALQGSLSNFAAGVLMIIFRPFKIGDYVEGGGTAGTIEAISIFTTHLKTPDNKLIIVPNGKMMSDNITNYSAKEIRRVDLIAGIGYGEDIDKAKAALKDILAKDDRVLDDPPANVAVKELADSSVNFVVRPWVKTADYWSVYFDITEAIKKRFDAEDINIPFPQRDVHLYKHDL